MIARLAFKSLRNRKLTSILTICSIAIGIALFLGIERVRFGVRDSFSNSISQTDLIVGARGGSLPLLLYTVFHIGSATNNISYSTYEHFKKHPAVKWTIPFSMGDSHRGYRVVATDQSFYEEFRYRQDQSLSFKDGKLASGIWDVVLGADAAEALDYKLGEKITLSHGIAAEGQNFYNHDDKPFRVVGILKKTATPIDRSLYISLQGMEALHIDWSDGAPAMSGQEITAAQLEKSKIRIGQITSFTLRSKSRIDALYLQREINEYTKEPMMAIIPGVALNELWQGLGYVESALRIVSLFVVIAGFLGVLVTLLTSLEQRRREMAILRALGAGAVRIMGLLIVETSVLILSGISIGVIFVYLALYFFQDAIQNSFGLYVPIQPPTAEEYLYLLILWVGSFLIALLPAIKAYRTSLADGLSVKV